MNESFCAPAESDRQIRDAFDNYHNARTLAASPLIRAQWIVNATVSGEHSGDRERINALRTFLQWGVEQLAPARAEYPFGVARPLTDLTWTDPSWWSYTLLRHTYIEPIPPDDFFEGSKLTGTLIAWTGIPGRRAFQTALRRALNTAAAFSDTHQPARPESGQHTMHSLTGHVMEWVRTIGFITSPVVESKADISRATAKRVLASAVQAGLLKKTGRGKNTRYVIPFSSGG